MRRVTGSGRAGGVAPAATFRISDSAPKTMPSPIARPRFALLSGVLGSEVVRYSHRILPDLASIAKMSCWPVGRYMTPSLTTGVACCEYGGPKPEFNRAIQAPFNVFTFEGLICASVEKRVLPQSPPTRGHSAEGGFR